MEPSSSTTAETPVTSDAPSESYPNPTSPSPTIVLHPRREAFEHGLLPIPKLIYTDGTLTLASIKQKLLSAAAKSSQITSTVLAEVVDIPIDQAALVIDTLVSVLPPLSPRPSDEEEDEGVADVFDLMLFLYIQSYKRLLTRTHKDSATVTDVWPSTSVFDGVLSTLSPLQLVRSNTRRLMPSQVDEEAHQLSYLNKHISNMLNLLAESVEGEGDESLVLSLERFEHLGFLIHFCENGSKRVLLSQISPFFANSDPDMPAAPVSITQIHEWLQQNINASLDHITEKISAKDNITQPVLDVDITMADACNSNMKGSIGCDPMDSRNLTFVEGISKASVCKHGGDIKGNTVKVSHCHDSVIYILAPLRYATVYGCSDATIVLGAIGKAVRIEHCERVHIIAACKRICIANCRECIFYLGVNQRPLILGDNHKLQVAPYNTFYTQLNEHMNEVNVQATINKWNEPLILGMIDPHDSLSHPAGVSDIQAESATCLDPELFTNFLIPNLLKAESKQPTKENPFSLPGEYSASLRKKHVAVVNIQQAISVLIPLLPPLSRAQCLLLQMSSLAAKLFEVSPNPSIWLTAFRGTLPTFSSSPPPSFTVPKLPLVSTTKEVLVLFTSLQTQLFEAVGELQEILNLQDAKAKLSREIRAINGNLLGFSKKIGETEKVLDNLMDDYEDYHRLKRKKVGEEKNEDDGDEDIRGSSFIEVKDILSYAHRISYTTFAPPEYASGQVPLRGALPPAPQDEQMRASQLYHVNELNLGLPNNLIDAKDKMADKVVEHLIEPEPVSYPQINVPPGWRKGMPVDLQFPMGLPPVPPGWKPGDPIPLPPLEPTLGDIGRVEEKMAAVPSGPIMAPLHPRHPEPIQVKYVQLDINPEDDSSDDSSGAASSDSEV